jgi:PAS domain S-box-containing protein
LIISELIYPDNPIGFARMGLKKEVSNQILDLLQKNPQGLKITDVIKIVGINRNTAGRYLENLLVSGQVELRRLGMAKIYTISHRVPLSAVLSISSELVVQLDSFLRIIFANEPFCKLVGTDGKNLLGKNIEYTPVALVFDESFAKFIEKIREGSAGKEWSGEIELNSKCIIIFCRIAPTVFEDGRKGVTVILEDITQRKHGEKALQESEATALALVNAPTDSVVLMDSQGVILTLNETAALRFGRPADELVGVLVDNLLPKEIARKRRSLISQIFKTKDMVRFEDERDGLWFDTVAYPILNETGEVTRIAVIARDITDRRNTEQALIQSEQRFRYLITTIGDIVWEIDAKARFVYVSPQVETILGYKPEELIGHTPFEFLHPDTIPLNHKKFKTASERQAKSIVHESQWVHKDGHLVTIESNAIKLYDSNGSFSGFIGIDRKR